MDSIKSNVIVKKYAVARFSTCGTYFWFVLHRFVPTFKKEKEQEKRTGRSKMLIEKLGKL